MLDDHAGRHVEALDAFPCRIGVGDVVVAELLALQLPGQSAFLPEEDQRWNKSPSTAGMVSPLLNSLYPAKDFFTKTGFGLFRSTNSLPDSFGSGPQFIQLRLEAEK